MVHARVIRSVGAERDLELLFEYIALDGGVDRAEAVLRRIAATTHRLADFPGIGKIHRDLEGAPRAFSVWPWLVIYERLPDGDGIYVLRVIDGRRDLPRHMAFRS